MSAHANGPRAGSRAYTALAKLYALGGQATFAEWMNGVQWSGSIREFEQTVVGELVRQRLAFQRGNTYVIMDDGLARLGIAPDAPALAAPVLTGPRYVPAPRPLSQGHMARLRLMREGAFDYLDIPSLLGSTRVAFQSSLKVAGGDAQG